MTQGPATPGRPRWRWLLLPAVVIGLAAFAALVVAPRILRVVGARLLAGEWGGPAEVDAAWWNLGRELRMRGARVYLPGQPRPLARAKRVVMQFERSFLSGDPGKLLLGVFEDGEITHEGQFVTFVERVRYDAVGVKRLEIQGVDGELLRGREAAWVEPIARITDAPGVRSDGQGAPLEQIAVHETVVRVRFPRTDGDPIPVMIHDLAARMRMEGPKTLRVEDLGARLLGGRARGFGRVDWNAAAEWHVQMHLLDVDLEHAAREAGVLPRESHGVVSGFLDLTQPAGAAWLAGAGWVEGKDVRLWDQPVMAGLLRTLGLTAGPDDAMRDVRARFHVDLGHVYADELIATGRPLNLFATGSVRGDGEDLDVRFVPRLFSKDLGARVPVVGKPTQYLLDIINGQLVEVRLTGSLSQVEVQVNPIASISAPLKAFLSLFSNGK